MSTDSAKRPQAFVSHSSRDRLFVESKLLPLFKEVEVDAWYSKEEIRARDEWESRIRVGLESSEWFVVVLSDSAITSRWVKAEVHWALTNRIGKVVPVKISDCNHEQLHLQLALIHYIDFRDECAANQFLAIWRDGKISGATPKQKAAIERFMLFSQAAAISFDVGACFGLLIVFYGVAKAHWELGWSPLDALLRWVNSIMIILVAVLVVLSVYLPQNPTPPKRLTKRVTAPIILALLFGAASYMLVKRIPLDDLVLLGFALTVMCGSLMRIVPRVHDRFTDANY